MSDLKETTQLLAQAYLVQKELDKPAPDLSQEVARYGLSLYSVLVCGEIKKGKSSFLNALLGSENLVPISSDVATACLFKIRYGKKLRYTVFYKPDTGKGSLEISVDQLDTYGTEKGNPGNEKQVEYIAVECPSSLLKDGLVFVDSPGLGGLYRYHKAITLEAAAKANAACFVTDSVESPISAEEVAFLKQLKAMNPRLFFVQTKSDLADTEACSKRKENNLSILLDEVHLKDEEIFYFITSSELKRLGDAEKCTEDLTDSGFASVNRFINGYLKRKRDEQLQDEAGRMVEGIICSLEALLKERGEALEAIVSGRESEFEVRLKEKSDELDRIESKDLTQIQQQFVSRMAELQESAILDVNKGIRAGGQIASDAEEILQKKENANMVYQAAEDVSASVLQKCQVILKETTASYSDQVSCALEEAMSQIGKKVSLNMNLSQDSSIQLSDTGKLSGFKDKTADDGLRKAKAAVIHGGIGATAAKVVGGLLGSVIPVVGTGAGIVLGMGVVSVLGGLSGIDEVTDSSKKEAVAKVNKAINNLLVDVHQSAVQKLRRVFGNIQKEGLDTIQSFVQKAKLRQRELKQEISKLKKEGLVGVKKAQGQHDVEVKLVTELREKLGKL